MPNKQNSKFKIIHSNKENLDIINKQYNTEIENIILSASQRNNSSEVKVYFKNIPAEEYDLGYKKFCGIKIDDLVFYNPSLFDLYPNLIDFLYIHHKDNFKNFVLENNLNDIYFSEDETLFSKNKKIIESNLYLNLNITFDEVINVLDKITKSIYGKSILKILTLSSIKK